MIDRESRRDILRRYGASAEIIDELLDYTNNEFHCTETYEVPADELFVDVWRGYADEARRTGAYSVLRRRLVQLAFPIENGISATEAYVSATRKGHDAQDGTGLGLRSPDALRIQIHPTPAGSIPLLMTSERRDFVALVQALVRRNEPVPVPESMGACMVSGYNNWDRIRSHKLVWERSRPSDSWEEEFHRFACHKERYQDRFILLSDGPYSGIQAKEMGMPEDIWREASLILRREHECTHYYTRRMLGSMRNNLLDELIADFMGIVAVSGYFRADWFLRFMGLEESPLHPRRGRFENYTNGLSEGSRLVLQRLLVDAARNLEVMPMGVPHLEAPYRQAAAIRNLAVLTIEELAVGMLASH